MMDSLKSLKVTQKDLARIMEVSEPQITRIKQGKADMTIAQYVKIKKAINPAKETEELIFAEALKNELPRRTRKKRSGV